MQVLYPCNTCFSPTHLIKVHTGQAALPTSIQTMLVCSNGADYNIDEYM